jgi:hypothetical protein
MVWQFIDVFKRVTGSNRIKDDDFSDRLNHRWTVALLLLFCILVGSSQFVGSPIGCWAPAHFSGSMVTYTNYMCWISNTYYVPTDDFLPVPGVPRVGQINYYQWVPFILVLMAFLFYFPFCLWHLMAKPSGLDSRTIMKIISSMDATSSESKDKAMRSTVKIIDRAIDYHRDYYEQNWLGRMRRSINRCCLPRHASGYYISSLYMLIKLLYVVNVCGQFFLLNLFMGPKFNLYGFDVIRDLANGKNFWESSRFPRVTMCDFTIRTLGENNQKYTLQCTLPINLFNEKIFIFIWFWYCLIAALSVYTLLYWMFTFGSSSRMSFVKRYLKVNDRLGGFVNDHHSSSSTTSSSIVDLKILDAFLYEYLRQDGVFLLRIIKKNSNDIVVGELVCALWDNFKRYPKFSMQHHVGAEMEKDTEKLNGMN